MGFSVRSRTPQALECGVSQRDLTPRFGSCEGWGAAGAGQPIAPFRQFRSGITSTTTTARSLTLSAKFKLAFSRRKRGVFFRRHHHRAAIFPSSFHSTA